MTGMDRDGGRLTRVPAVLTSPHLDDAALSACAEIAKGGALVVTVFTAVPPPDWPPTWWDRLTGESADSRARQLARRAEDAEAMRLLGARNTYLDQPEQLHRDGDPDREAIVKALASCYADADEVWLPAGIGAHPDHIIARDAGLEAAALAGHTEVVLYADFPYVILYGWPASVRGTGDRLIDADFWLTDQLQSTGLDPAALEPRALRLSPAQRVLKRQIIEAYQTQAPALGLGGPALAADPTKLDYELSWRMAVPEPR
ncbi:LmbE family N-acetylglucosaminyl deacetylase [Catenulispora sp. GP43]|uniref:PIG-L family deacetylase n=1 Tax=Catenulispora sp. GP43 TaxID=3156263 RepID=UPI0035155369